MFQCLAYVNYWPTCFKYFNETYRHIGVPEIMIRGRSFIFSIKRIDSTYVSVSCPYVIYVPTCFKYFNETSRHIGVPEIMIRGR